MTNPPFRHVAVIGLGLLGSSLAHAVRACLPGTRVTGFDADLAVRDRAQVLGMADAIADTAAQAVTGADLVVLCVPVGAMADAAHAMAPGLAEGVIISDVGSSKASVASWRCVSWVSTSTASGSSLRSSPRELATRPPKSRAHASALARVREK